MTLHIDRLKNHFRKLFILEFKDGNIENLKQNAPIFSMKKDGQLIAQQTMFGVIYLVPEIYEDFILSKISVEQFNLLLRGMLQENVNNAKLKENINKINITEVEKLEHNN